MQTVKGMVPYEAFHRNSVLQFENLTDSSIEQVGDVYLSRAHSMLPFLEFRKHLGFGHMSWLRSWH